MNININPNTSFKGINIKNGGIEYVREKDGELAISRLNNAKEEFNNSKWTLNIDENGYTLKSPTTKKIYEGPFSVKKLYKTGAKRTETSKLVIRMDKSNRIKFPINLPDKYAVLKLYTKIKNSKGLEKMLLILSALENHIKL